MPLSTLPLEVTRRILRLQLELRILEATRRLSGWAMGVHVNRELREMIRDLFTQRPTLMRVSILRTRLRNAMYTGRANGMTPFIDLEFILRYRYRITGQILANPYNRRRPVRRR